MAAAAVAGVAVAGVAVAGVAAAGVAAAGVVARCGLLERETDDDGGDRRRWSPCDDWWESLHGSVGSLLLYSS